MIWIFLFFVCSICFLFLYSSIPHFLTKFPNILKSYVFKPHDPVGKKENHYSCFENLRMSPARARNCYVKTADTGDSLGVWHILPYEANIDGTEELRTHEEFDTQLAQNVPIVLYFHGNSKTRSVYWRINVYKLLSSLGYNVVTFDYRGFGDSSGKMNCEMDCVYDAMAVIKWIHQRCGQSPVFFYGHSLGTGVIGSLMRHLISEQETQLREEIPFPTGIILDAPFTSLAQVCVHRKLMWPYRVVPYMRKKIDSLTSSAHVEFNTENNLSDCRVPLLILHAEDDRVVPFKLGEQLSKSLSPVAPVQFVPFEAKLGYRHNFIHTAPEMPELLRLRGYNLSSQLYSLSRCPLQMALWAGYMMEPWVFQLEDDYEEWAFCLHYHAGKLPSSSRARFICSYLENWIWDLVGSLDWTANGSDQELWKKLNSLFIDKIVFEFSPEPLILEEACVVESVINFEITEPFSMLEEVLLTPTLHNDSECCATKTQTVLTSSHKAVLKTCSTPEFTQSPPALEQSSTREERTVLVHEPTLVKSPTSIPRRETVRITYMWYLSHLRLEHKLTPLNYDSGDTVIKLKLPCLYNSMNELEIRRRPPAWPPPLTYVSIPSALFTTFLVPTQMLLHFLYCCKWEFLPKKAMEPPINSEDAV